MSIRIELPRGRWVNMNDDYKIEYPEDFKEQIEECFREYTLETSKEYTDCDRLGFVDCCKKRMSGIDNQYEYGYEVVNNKIKTEMVNRWDEEGEFLEEDDIYNADFMVDCYREGVKSTILCSHFGYDNHYIYDELQRLLVRIVKTVMNCKVYDEEGRKIPTGAKYED